MNILSAIGTRGNSTMIVAAVTLAQILFRQSQGEFRRLNFPRQKEIIIGILSGGAVAALTMQGPFTLNFRGGVVIAYIVFITFINLVGKLY